MDDNKLNILAIAPYEGLKLSIIKASQQFPNVKLEAHIGDLEEGVRIVKSLALDHYDCILSRGGTADKIRKISSLPLVDIKISVYDVLRSIKLAENYGKKYAIVGFPSVTEPAHTLCVLLGYNIDIHTINEISEVKKVLLMLKENGYSMVISDMVAHTTARKLGMDAFLITSGQESILSSIEQAIHFSKVFKRVKRENIFLNTLVDNTNSLLAFSPTGDLIYSKPTNIPGDLITGLKGHIKAIEESKEGSFYLRSLNSLYTVKGKVINYLESPFVVFNLKAIQNSTKYLKEGIKFYHWPEVEFEFLNSFYSISGAMGELEGQIKALANSRQGIIICGQGGTGKEQIARALFLNSPWRNNPYIVINCKSINDKNWDYLLNNPDSPLYHIDSTFYFQYLDDLDLLKLENLKNLIKDTGLMRRHRLIFSSTYTNDGILNEDLSSFSNYLGCLRIELASLRDRCDEIPYLASLYLNSLNHKLGKEISGFEPRALDQLRNYPWPNNYTQFKKLIYELALLTDSAYISSNLVAETLAKEPYHIKNTPSQVENLSNISLEGTLEDITRRIIKRAVIEAGGNKAKAARKLSIGRSTVWRYLDDKNKI